MKNLYFKVRTIASEKGQGLVEYALILAGVAVLAVGVFAFTANENSAIRVGIDNLFNSIGSSLETVGDEIETGAGVED